MSCRRRSSSIRACGDGRRLGGGERHRQQPCHELAARQPLQGGEPERSAQRRELLVVGLGTDGIGGERVGIDIDLVGQAAGLAAGSLPRSQQAAWVAEARRAEGRSRAGCGRGGGVGRRRARRGRASNAGQIGSLVGSASSASSCASVSTRRLGMRIVPIELRLFGTKLAQAAATGCGPPIREGSIGTAGGDLLPRLDRRPVLRAARA